MTDRNKAEILITGKNQSKPAFDEIVRSGEAVSTSLEQAGARGARSLENVQKAAQAFGAGLSTITLLSDKAAGESEAAAARLEGAFENAGLALDQYEARIDALGNKGIDLGFDDEDVTDSLAKLTLVTKNYAQAQADAQLAENIARQEHLSLAAATDTVRQAELGRTRGLAAVGVAITEGMTSTEALIAAQQQFAGAAERASTTGEVAWERYRVKASNVLEEIGGKIHGFEPEIIALSGLATAAPPVVSGFREITQAAGLTATQLGPIGIGVAAAAGIAAIAFHELSNRTQEWEKAADSAENATLSLKDAIATFGAEGAPKTASALKEVDEVWAALAKDGAEYTKQVAELNQQLKVAQTEGDSASVVLAELQSKALSSNSIDKITADIQDLFNKPGIDAAKAAHDIQYYFDLFKQGMIDEQTLVSYLDESAQDWTRYSNAVVLTADEQAHWNEVAQQSIEIMNAMVAPLTQIPAEMNLLAQEAAASSMTLLGQQSVAAARTAKEMDTLAQHRAEAFSEMARAQESSLGSLIASNNRANADAYAEQQTQLALSQDRFNVWASGLETSFGTAITATNEYSADHASAMSVIAQHSDQAMDAITRATDAGSAKIQQAQAELDQYAQSLGQVPALGDSHAAHFAQNAEQAGSALGDAFRVAVGNTNDIGGQAEQVDKWARSLINVKGQYGEIDDLLSRGIIDQREYNTAQDAATSIFAANKAIQDDILKIQTDQAPVIAKATEEQQRYLDHLASLRPEEQALRLAYMDTNESLKAQQALALATAAAHGELGVQGEESAQKLIAGAAEADPALRQMLEDLHLIHVDKDTGEITVDFGQVDDASASLDDVIDALRDIAGLLEDAFDIDIDSSDADIAAARLQTTVDLLNQLNNTSVTYYVNAAGNGVSVGNPTGAGIRRELHGGVVGYLGGGTVRAEMAEVDDEIVHLAGGGTARTNGHGVYNVPVGSYVDTAPMTRSLTATGGPTIKVIVQGNVYGMDDLTDKVIDQLAPALELALEQHYKGFGVTYE